MLLRQDQFTGLRHAKVIDQSSVLDQDLGLPQQQLFGADQTHPGGCIPLYGNQLCLDVGLVGHGGIFAGKSAKRGLNTAAPATTILQLRLSVNKVSRVSQLRLCRVVPARLVS